jgi:mono/diheme cytochrome c family protein
VKRVLILIVSLASAAAVRAQDPSNAPQGLAVTFEPLGGGTADTRVVRLPALYVPKGAAPSVFLPPGRFKATWRGDLNLRLRERLAFTAEGRGKITVSIKDKVVFEAEGEDLSQKIGEVTRINKGANSIVVTYQSPADGDAFVRLMWKEQNGVRPEPVPPMVFTYNPGEAGVAEGTKVRTGRQLLAELRCTKCHVADDLPPGAMPELAMDAPSLTDAGARLQRDWLAAWVENPKALRNDAHMPRVLPDAAAARDVAAYLASIGTVESAPPAADAALVTRGGQLFSMFNCVACHTSPDAAAVAGEDPRVPLTQVKAKFQPAALRQYLLAPEGHYAWNPMPNFKLSGDEAAALSAYLLDKAKGTVPRAGDGNVENGRRLVRSSGCLNCHSMEGETSELKAPTLAELKPPRFSHGCMAPVDAVPEDTPRYGLADGQRAALAAFVATDRSSLTRDAADEFSARQVAAMRCTACHGRDGRESLIGNDFAADAATLAAAFPPPPPAGGGGVQEGEHFAPDQRPPILTWAGEKLRPEWAAEFIAGRIPHRIRPYLHARMPAWPARAELLARGLAAEHGYSPSTPPYPPPDEPMAAVGQKLIGTVGGFSCVQCHAVGAAPPNAPFEAPALNLRHVTARLRKDYYHRWMLNPIKVDPATKMPAFADFEGKSAIRDVYEGDGVKQFEAIWQFMLRGDDVKPAD